MGVLSLVLGLSWAAVPAFAADAPNPDDCSWIIELDTPLMDNGEGPLTLYFNRSGGTWAKGFGNAQTWNRSWHDVDVSALNAGADALKGAVKVTINPDQWTPVDGKPIACAYTIDAAVKGAKIDGTFKGTFGNKAVKGKVTGKLVAKGATAIENCQLDVTLENAVRFTDENARRITLWWKRVDGKSGEGRAASEENEVKFDSSTLTLTPDAIKGPLAIPFPAPGGKYEYELDGVVVANEFAGKYKAKGSKQEFEGRFVGSLGPLKAKR
jgi:hypothetical protein